MSNPRASAGGFLSVFSKRILLRREWGIGKGEWGIGKGEWGMGNGELGMGKEVRVKVSPMDCEYRRSLTLKCFI